MKLKYLFLLGIILLVVFSGCSKDAEVEEIKTEEKAEESSEEVVSGLTDIASDLQDIEDIVE